jgi:hypothetical protein
MLRFAILSIAFSFLAGCDDPPEKVTVEMCVLSPIEGTPDFDCVCGVKAPDMPIVNFRHESLAYCANATTFPPEAWEKYHTYIEQLEDWVARAKAKIKK